MNPKAIMIGFGSDNGGPCDLSLEEQLENNQFLSQNYPNPFSNTTTIEFEFNDASGAEIEVMDPTGKVLHIIQVSAQENGLNQVIINADNLESGTYFYTLSSQDFSVTKKMVVKK